MSVPQVARVLYCIEMDAVTNVCTAQTWLPAPSILPPLETAEVAELLGFTALALASAWGWKQLGRTIRN